MMNSLHVIRLGLTDYNTTWDLQKRLFFLRSFDKIPDVLLLAEHNHVYTIGKSGSDDHLLSNEENLQGVDIFRTDRGGDITYHGPGQIVGYPILDLKNYYLDIHRYLRDLEKVIMLTLADFGIPAHRDESFTGVWVGNDKIAAIGIKVNRWITMHGFALNVNTDLSYFDKIIPCGIFHKGVTSMEKVLNHTVEMGSVFNSIVGHFGELFNISIVNLSSAELIDLLNQFTKEQVESLR